MAPPYTFSNSYSSGQCTWYVAGRRQVPHGWGNADTWYQHAREAGWGVGATPAIGAIAWTSSGYYGHVALVEVIEGTKIQISEMNYLGDYQIDHRWVDATSFQYIY
jgi:surface antigen